ncbi:MAG: argininosuccinate synthase [Calditrichaeota bacterium]|nr:argininosuccinate synthase [Calditrichota bacterium]
MKKKVTLAFSGGLDTSFCAEYLANEHNLEVYSVTVNTGGFSEREMREISERAKALGVKEHRNVNIEDRYYDRCIRYLIYGNVLRNGTYPLSVSAERVFQAMAIADYAKEIGSEYIAHGSTGAGNDQVRFDMIFNILVPEMEILTPVRDRKLSRDEEIAYLKKRGVKLDWSQTDYSVNQGLWGTSVGGKETLRSDLPLPENAYPTKASKTESKDLELQFEKGEFVGFDGARFENSLQAIKELEKLVSPYGIGRDIHIGDTIIGIKGRVGFEAAAPMVIIKAHQTLEKHVLTKWQLYWKDQLANWYGMLLHEGQYFDPVMRDIEAFLEHTQSVADGKVFVRLHPYRFEILGIESPNDLMDSRFAAYGEMNYQWDGADVRGFAKIMANQSRIYRTVHEKKEKKP